MGTRRKIDLDECVERIWQKQLASFDSGNLISAEQLLLEFPQVAKNPEAITDVVLNEFELLSRDDSNRNYQNELLDRFPQVKEQLERHFVVWNAFETAQTKSSDTVSQKEKSCDLEGKKSTRFLDRKVIGRGGTAIVETAIDQTLKQKVALKRLHVHLKTSQRAMHRFNREAHAVSRLHHPGIVPVFEITEDGDDVVLVSRYVNGANLRILVDGGKAYSIKDVAKWMCQIADALHYAHENGVVHRDVKPSNVLVNEDGNAMLIDFGLALLTESSSDITATGDLVGTPAFMSPEQAAGNWGEISPQTDVYSAGATLYFLLTGQTPFLGSVPSVIRSVIEDPPTPFESTLVDKNHDLVTIMGKCLSKSPVERYQSARELAEDLRRFQSGEVLLAKRASPIERVVKYVARNPVRSATLATILLLSAFLLGALIQLGQVRLQRNRAENSELKQRRLMVAASVDAGRLSMRQGKLEQAVEHFETASAKKSDREVEVHLLLVECLLATGQIDGAVEQLELAKQLCETQQEEALIEYWEFELAVLRHSGYTSRKFMGNRENLSSSKKFFLAGIESENSEQALAFFRESFLADPYHHSARKMYLVMALSLAHFDIVFEESHRATQLYPDDVDFRLFKALAIAARQDFENARIAIDETTLTKIEKERWKAFFVFLEKVSKPLADQEFFLVQRLDWFADVFETFVEQHLGLFEDRRWMFPLEIGKKFSNLISKYRTGSSFEELRGEFRELVQVHPEGTLLVILAEGYLAGVDMHDWRTIEKAQDLFKMAAGRPAWLGLAPESSWLGLYTTAMTLRVVNKRDKEENGELMKKAVDNIDPNWLIFPGNIRAMVIPLFEMKEWERLKPLIDRGIQIAKSDKQKQEAWWHLAVWHRYQENWIAVKATCDKVDTILPADMKRTRNWQGLRNRALRELKDILGAGAE